MGRLHELGKEIAIAIERRLDCGERFLRGRQPKVGRIQGQAFSCGLQGFEGFAAAEVGFGQSFAGALHLATAGGGRRMARSQGFVGGSPAPFFARGTAFAG